MFMFSVGCSNKSVILCFWVIWDIWVFSEIIVKMKKENNDTFVHFVRV